MKHALRQWAAALFLAAWAGSQPAHAALRLVFDVKTQADEPRDKKTVHSESNDVVTLVLGKDYFTLESGGSRVAYDFQKRRVYGFAGGTNAYSDDSLYAFVAFRVMELQNRASMNDVLSGAGLKAGDPSAHGAVFYEHELSLVLPGATNKPDIKEATSKMGVSFTSGRKDLFFYAKDQVAVSYDQAKQFARCVRHLWGAHPAILAKLETLGAIPKQLAITQYDMGVKKTTLTLTSSSDVEDAPLVPQGFRPCFHGQKGDRINAWLQHVRYEATNAIAERAKALLAEVETDFNSSNYFDGMLGLIEYSLQTGQRPPEGIGSHHDQLVADPSVLKYHGALNPKDAGQVKKSIAVFEQLEAVTIHHRHVIWIDLADDYMWLGKPDKAVDYFLRALEANPFITGAYKDLGDMQFGAYEMLLAWRCWDVARWMCPGHKMLDQIDANEKQLAADFPGFF